MVQIGALNPANQKITGVQFYHNNRLLKGYPVSLNYRPSKLASWTGDLVQRLVCTIDVTCLTPTHTKDDVTASSEFLDGLFKQIKSENSEIIKAARLGKRSQPGLQNPADDTADAKSVLDDIDNNDVLNPGNLVLAEEIDPEFQSLPARLREAAKNNEAIHESIFNHESTSFKYKIYLFLPSVTDAPRPHVHCEFMEDHWIININLSSPFRNYFTDFKKYVIACVLETLSEIYVSHINTNRPSHDIINNKSRIYFNEFLNNYEQITGEIFYNTDDDENDDENNEEYLID